MASGNLFWVRNTRPQIGTVIQIQRFDYRWTPSYRGSWNTLKHILTLTCLHSKSQWQRQTDNMVIELGGTDFSCSSGKFQKIKASPKISLSVKLRCQSALFLSMMETISVDSHFQGCSLQSKLGDRTFHFVSFSWFAYADLTLRRWPALSRPIRAGRHA